MCKPQGDKEWLRCEKVWTEKRLTFGAVSRAWKSEWQRCRLRSRCATALRLCRCLGGSAIGVGLCFFGLFEKVDSSRIWPATEPYPNHWTHHVVVVPEDDIGDEIKARIHAAYSFALIK